VPRPVDRDLARALYHIKKEALSIHQQLPTIRIDDMVNALDFAGGKTIRAAEILSVLHHRRSARQPRER
jgi:hypothetical protein